MISVFFNCSSPYVGFRLLQADYTQEKMVACSEKEMTPIGYKLFNSSGSYMLLGTVDNRKYFHSCESQSVQYDEQGRPIHNSVAFLAGSAKDAPIINAIAAYVFFNEEAFYSEMAKYITLLDDGYTVDFKALAAFLKKFEQGCQIQTEVPAAGHFFRDILSSDGSYDIDFIVRQSTWNYFVKQVGRDFTRNEKYNMSDTQGEALAGQGTVVFGRCPSVRGAETVVERSVHEDVVEPEKKAEPVCEQKNVSGQAPSGKENIPQASEAREQELLTLRGDCAAKTQLLVSAEKKAAELLYEVSRLRDAIKKSFWLGLAVGVIGTAIAVLIYGLLKYRGE